MPKPTKKEYIVRYSDYEIYQPRYTYDEAIEEAKSRCSDKDDVYEVCKVVTSVHSYMETLIQDYREKT